MTSKSQTLKVLKVFFALYSDSKFNTEYANSDFPEPLFPIIPTFEMGLTCRSISSKIMLSDIVRDNLSIFKKFFIIT